MIKILITKKNDDIIKINCSGHAEFADYGKDIVCAGVSCITQTALLGLKNLTSISHKSKIDESGYLELEINDIENKSQDFKDAQIILKTMLLGLEDIKSQYPKFVKLEVKNI